MEEKSREIFEDLDEVTSEKISELFNFVICLLIFLLIFDNSADFDG